MLYLPLDEEKKLENKDSLNSAEEFKDNIMKIF